MVVKRICKQGVVEEEEGRGRRKEAGRKAGRKKRGKT